MLVLDGGSWWSNWSCATRPLYVYAAMIVVVIALCGVLRLRARIEVWYRAAPAMKISPGEKRARPYVIAFAFAVALVLAIVPPLARHRDMVFVERESIVEAGCHMFSPFRYEFATDGARISYVFREGRKGSDQHVLSMRSSGPGRTLVIYLETSRYLGNLAAFAPEEMTKYAGKLLETGRSVPVALQPLLSPQPR